MGEALDKFTTHSYETGVIKGSGSLPKFGPVVKVRKCASTLASARSACSGAVRRV